MHPSTTAVRIAPKLSQELTRRHRMHPCIRVRPQSEPIPSSVPRRQRPHITQGLCARRARRRNSVLLPRSLELVPKAAGNEEAVHTISQVATNPCSSQVACAGMPVGALN
jgi:hypothetical protein